MIVYFVGVGLAFILRATMREGTSAAVLFSTGWLIMAIGFAMRWLISELREMLREQSWNAAMRSAENATSTDTQITSQTDL
jgi:hypothetical protein